MLEIWEVFHDLATGREQGINGPASLSWNTINSYCILMNVRFSRYDLDIIRRLDNLWLKTMREAKT